MAECEKRFDRNAALAAAEKIVDYADYNVSMFEACCDETPQKANDILCAAQKLRDLLK